MTAHFASAVVVVCLTVAFSSPARASQVFDWWADLWDKATDVLERRPGLDLLLDDDKSEDPAPGRDASGRLTIRVVKAPAKQGACVLEEGSPVSCRAMATLACRREGYETGRPLEVMAFTSCRGVIANLTNGGECKLKRRVNTAVCW